VPGLLLLQEAAEQLGLVLLLLHLRLLHLLLLCCLVLHQRSCLEGLQVLLHCCFLALLLQGCQRSQEASLKLRLRREKQKQQHA
jgi:hypothetical protein